MPFKLLAIGVLAMVSVGSASGKAQAGQTTAPEFRLGQLVFGFQLDTKGCRQDEHVPAVSRCIAFANGEISYAGFPIHRMYNSFFDGRLFDVHLEMSGGYHDILTVLKTAFGEPSHSTVPFIQDGRDVGNSIWTWKIKDGELQLKEHGGFDSFWAPAVIATHGEMSAEYGRRRSAWLADEARKLLSPQKR